MSLAIVILAAGKGTRMESDLAKVLHPLGGKPLIAWVLEATSALQPDRTVVVVGHQAEAVAAAVRERFDGIKFVTQPEMLGTGHAVQQAEPPLRSFDGDIIVTCGDVPLITTARLRQLVNERRDKASAISMLVATVDNPSGYGRVVTEADGNVTAIVEQKDATTEIATIQNVNAGTYCFDSQTLWRYLARVNNNNRSGEYYLTDVVGLATEAGLRVSAVFIGEREMTGINTKAQLQQLEAELHAARAC